MVHHLEHFSYEYETPTTKEMMMRVIAMEVIKTEVYRLTLHPLIP